MNRKAVPFAVVVLLALAGCTGLPESSEVSARGAITDAGQVEAPNVQFYGPQGGESTVQIVTQFLRANGGIKEDFAVARQFLTPAAQETWTPGPQVYITRGESDFVVTGANRGQVRLSVTERAELDPDGTLREFGLPRHRNVTFDLAKVRGEWRIQKLPENFGPYLSNVDFQRLFQRHTVYLPEMRTRTLVPQARYFSRTGVTTALARAVLDGAQTRESAQEQPELLTLPTGTRLAVDAVPVSADGVAAVDLTSSVMRADPETRRALWAAMLETVGRAPGVRRVVLTVGGAPFDTEDLPSEPGSASSVGYAIRTPSAIGRIQRTGDSLAWVDRGNVRNRQVPESPRLPALTSNWYLLAATDSGASVVGVSGDRTALARWRGGASAPQTVTLGWQLTRPSFNGLDEMWVGGVTQSATGPNREAPNTPGVWVASSVDSGRAISPQLVRTSWLSGEVLSVAAAADGQRVVLVVKQGEAVRLLLSNVLRDTTGEAIALTEGVPVTQAVVGIADAAWASDDTLAVLGRPIGGGPPQVLLVPLSGFVTSLGEVSGATDVVGTGRDVSDLHVLTNRRTVLTRVGSGWQTIRGVRDVVVPGT